MTDDRTLDDLIAALWESDDASVLTNQAARMLEKLRAENARLKKKAVEDSWIINPDRMGGQFTQEEIDRSRNGGW
jgi:hypothetical protein